MCILLANSTLFGCGMNLENSSHIIFVHKMNEKMENQVIGRAQRLGRKGILNIIYLEYENELIKAVDEKQINNIENIEDICNDIKNNQQTNLEDLDISGNINNNTYFEFNNNSGFNIDLDLNNNQETSLDNINNYDNNIELPSYDEVVDINLDELISNLL